MAQTYSPTSTANELANDLASQINGKVVLTTGVSPSTLGSSFVQSIATAQPKLLILAGRNTTKLEKVASTISAAHPRVQIRLLELDLFSLAAVRDSAAKVNAWDDVPHIDILVNNAGVMATEFKLSPEGVESQFATNHLGHFLFANLVMDKILAASEPCIVNVSSDGHRLSPMRWGDHNFEEGKNYDKWRAYGQSKTANMLFTVALAQKLGPKRGLLAFSLHPGVIIDTSLGSHIDWNVDFATLRNVDRSLGNAEGWGKFQVKSLDQGAATHVFAAFEPSLKDHNGAYLLDCRVANPWTDTVRPWATDSVEAQRSWKRSEELVGQQFLY